MASHKAHRRRFERLLSRFACALMFVAVGIMALPGLAEACTSLYLGNQLTADGTVMYSRSEDYDPRHVKRFGVAEAADHDPSSEFYNNVGDGGSFSYPYPSHTLRFTYVYDGEAYTGDSDTYAAGGVNEKGVSMSATVTTSAGSAISNRQGTGVDQLVDSGIAECNIGSILLGQATTARGGCVLLGGIIDTEGSGECYQIIIADNTETWMFYALSGHQWVAFKLADDVASVNPNLGNLKVELDLDDTSNVIHSSGLVSTLKDNGLDTYFSDGALDIMGSYGRATTGDTDLESARSLTRYYQALSYLDPAAAQALTVTENSDGAVKTIVDPQLIFTPSSSNYTLVQAQRFLATRGEGTSYDATTNSALYAVGNTRQTECHLMQITQGRDAQVATVEWLAMSCAKYSVYLPYYSSLITDVADCCKVDTDQYESLSPTDYTFEGNIDQAFLDINTLCNENPDTLGTPVMSYFEALQTSINAQQLLVDDCMVSLYAADPDAAQERATTASVSTTTQLDQKAETLLAEMKAYLEAGDTSVPFVPSDMTAEGGVKDPLIYADFFIAPTITAQPADATYVQNSAVDDLTVMATENDGVDGSDALLTFQWFVKGGSDQAISTMSDVEAPEGYVAAGTGSSFTPSTDQVGTTTYLVRVTNAADVSTDSREATVTVTTPVKDDTTTPGDTTGGSTSGTTTSKPSTSPTPQTGDTTNSALPLALVAGGALAVACGVVAKRRSSR